MSEAETSEAERAKPRPRVPLSVQWHVTTECGNRCKHCYVYDHSTFEEERENTLSLQKPVPALELLYQKYAASTMVQPPPSRVSLSPAS